ncbi:MAG TPA: diaminopimelate epimerase [Gammaproteobacteria bacterium]
MRVRFAKMHGLGNDFMVVDWPQGRPAPEPDAVRRLADRRLGVGFDQLLLVTPAADGEHEAAYRIFNADGGEVEQCGNGARCIARFVAAQGRQRDGELTLASTAGPIEARIGADGQVSVNLGVPDFAPASLPFRAPEERDRYVVHASGRDVELGAVSIGNPHAVLLVDSVDTADVGILGAVLATHPDFPRGVNVGFLEIVRPDRVRLRVYERGVGETPACGTAAAAAVAVGRRWGALAEQVDVELRGGVLTVRWPGPGRPLWQTGPTTLVYEGVIEL